MNPAKPTSKRQAFSAGDGHPRAGSLPDCRAPANATATVNAQLPASSLESVQVDIELELAQISVPLSTLRALSVGQVFETSHHIDSPAVVLWCGGQRLGVGHLVAVGDRLGVRVAALNIGSADSDAPVAAAE